MKKKPVNQLRNRKNIKTHESGNEECLVRVTDRLRVFLWFILESSLSPSGGISDEGCFTHRSLSLFGIRLPSFFFALPVGFDV